MLSFDSALASQLKNANPVSFWVLKLYYNKEDNQSFQANGTTANLVDDAAFNATEATFTVDYGAAFVDGDYIKIDSEIMKVTNISTNLLTVERGKKNTTLASHGNNSIIYYDNWIGLSEQDRVDSGDMYHGLVSSWGRLSQSLDFFDFKSKISSMNVKLINTEYSFDGGRLSDVLSTYNFANRKWELFQNTSGLSTFDTAARMIGSGIISGGTDYNSEFISFSLLDYTSKYLNKKIPSNTVDSTTYSNAPNKNIGLPIPMAYGTFKNRLYTIGDENSSIEIGTVPANYFGKHITYKFPAIITNQWYVGGATDPNSGYVKANADNETLYDIMVDNVYIYNDGFYSSCLASNVSITEPTISFRGQSWDVFIPLNKEYNSASTVTVDDGTNAADGSFNTSTKITANSVTGLVAIYGFGKVPNLGTINTIKVLIKYGTLNNGSLTAFGFVIEDLAGITNSTPATNAEQSLTVSTTNFSQDSRDNWDFENSYPHFIITTSGNYNIQIAGAGLEVNYIPDDMFEKEITETYEKTLTTGGFMESYFQKDDGTVSHTTRITRTVSLSTPTIADYIYYSGIGRKYGAWIDTIDGETRDSQNGSSADPGYTNNGVMDNPVYIIEDILRTECGLDSGTTGAEIDVETFDAAGNATNGLIKNSLDEDAVTDIKFAFSQYKFITAKELIDRIAKLIGAWVFISGDSKVKIAIRKRSSHSSNKTIDYNDIRLKDIKLTPLNNVRNDITVKYDYDYGSDKNMSSRNVTDATSAGSSVGGYNITPSSKEDYMKLELDANEVINYVTAGKIANMYLAYFKDRYPIITFECLRPYYNDLEMGDIIVFENWDSKIKIYGTAMGTDYYMVSSISKTPFGCSIKAIKVS